MIRIGRALASGNLETIAKSTFRHPDLKQQLINKVLELIDGECALLCSRSQPGPFRCAKITKLDTFTWDCYIHEMEQKSPILLRLLRLIVSHSDHRNQQKQAEHHVPGICMTTAIMLKERNREMVGVQTHISLALFTSQVNKQVRECSKKHMYVYSLPQMHDFVYYIIGVYKTQSLKCYTKLHWYLKGD